MSGVQLYNRTSVYSTKLIPLVAMLLLLVYSENIKYLLQVGHTHRLIHIYYVYVVHIYKVKYTQVDVPYLAAN